MKNKKIDEIPQEKPKHRQPDYKSDGIAIWKNIDKNNNEYLSVKLIGHNTLYAYINKQK